MKKRILYNESNYEAIVLENGYFVDKTEYIAKLEKIKNPIFLRPRRFGKSTFCSLLWHYYDRGFADRFEELFGHTWIGQNPTGQQGQHIVLFFNFSTIATGPTIHDIEASFKRQCNFWLSLIFQDYADVLGNTLEVDLKASVADTLYTLVSLARRRGVQLFVIIDEYDNFANQLITTNRDRLYDQLTDDNGFLKAFFKTLKEGREMGAIANVFITGVLPILIDELASGFNVGSFITLDTEFEAMAGFTQPEVDKLLDELYNDYPIEPATRSEVDALIKNYYDGYHFCKPSLDDTLDDIEQGLYNSSILIYFLNHLQRKLTVPERLIDGNVKTDISWVKRLTASNNDLTEAFVNQLTLHNAIAFDEKMLVEQFDMTQFFDQSYFPISFFYLGMLTRDSSFQLRLPNLTMREIFVEYFNRIHSIDVSTRYLEVMQTFINRPNLEQLFHGYWSHYISQFPEAIFTQVNENFYRSTFFELCSRHLSQWFTWNIERSYPSGKSDLEFVGKYNEQFAGLRWVIEFKYISNSKLRTLDMTIDAFELETDDTEQISGYVEGLQQEYPEARISQYVIYCFGNQGFRIFEV
ncbi:MAG: AAA family ATPase [Chloroflexota bacterium]